MRVSGSMLGWTYCIDHDQAVARMVMGLACSLSDGQVKFLHSQAALLSHSPCIHLVQTFACVEKTSHGHLWPQCSYLLVHIRQMQPQGCPTESSLELLDGNRSIVLLGALKPRGTHPILHWSASNVTEA
jgi:hypothetical protein